MNRYHLLSFLAALLAGPLAHAAVEPAKLFTDHAVFQRSKPIPVWGTATPGESVTVSFADTHAQINADEAGHWRVDLPSQEASANGRPLTIRGENVIVVHDVLIGEVWLASGQSNMAWLLERTRDTGLDVVTADSFAMIRQFRVADRVAQQPETHVETSNGWRVASASTVGGFSAVAYYFAREVHLATGVPVGIINSSVGGTNIESWISPAAFAADPASVASFAHWEEVLAKYPTAKPAYDDALAAWEKERYEARDQGVRFTTRPPRMPPSKRSLQYPSNLYNAMIHGLAPVALQGVIWYQGEANAPRAQDYNTLFPTLIRDWRQTFHDEELDFFWVQLASPGPWGLRDGRDWAFLREAQSATLALPHTGQAVVLDISDVNDIHPRNKLDVGRRLARLALHRTYGFDVPDLSPTLRTAAREDDGFRLTYEGVYRGLFSPTRELSGFEIAGDDRDFHPAEAILDENNTIFVRSAAVPEPVAVRYAWINTPEGSLLNFEGLPALPFRTDNW